MKLKRTLGIALSLILGVSMLAGCQQEPVVAEVGKEKITLSQFNETFTPLKAQIESQSGPEVWTQDMNGKKYLDVVHEQVIDMLVQNRLIAIKAKELKLSVSDADLKTEVDLMKTQFGGEEKYQEFLKSQSMTQEFVDKLMREDLLSRKVQEAVTADIKITDEEVKAYYDSNPTEFEKVTASHILLENEADAKKALERVKAGEDFAKVAKEVSKDPSAAQNGGDLGSFGRGAMVPEFETAAFAMKAGEVSQPVQSQFGFHIIKVFENKVETLEEAKEAIRGNLLMTRQSEAFDKIMEDLKAANPVKTHPEVLVQK